jgi:hypothetical protein
MGDENFEARLLSSDDDPHVGQVTPHHLVSPAMRRVQNDFHSDPPSDDSNISVSPSSERVTRRMRSRTPNTYAKSSPLQFRMQAVEST